MLDELDLRQFDWGGDLAEAANRGPDEVVRVARRARVGLDDDIADDLGLEFADLLSLNIDPPGRRGVMASATASFAGPRTIARIGELLRTGVDGAQWKIDCGMAVFERNPGPHSAIQLLLCARESDNFAVMQRARGAFRGYPRALPELFDISLTEAPESDLKRFLAASLETAMVLGTRFPWAKLALARHTVPDVLKSIVWARYDGRRPIETFILDPEDDGWLNQSLASVLYAPDARIGVLHPAEISEQLRGAWGDVLADFELSPDFEQMGRHCETGRDHLPFHNIGEDVEHAGLMRFLLGRGWTGTSGLLTMDVRGARLMLTTDTTADGERRRIETILLRYPHGTSAGLERDVIYSEAVVETFALLERFAPRVLVEHS